MSLNILDCSLRDGGYYNLWNFRLKSVQEYINKVSEANIKFIEIGFRFFKKNSKFGNLAFSEDQYIKKLKVNKKISLAVMLNGSDIVNLGNQWKFFLNKIFSNQKESQIKIIRIATHFDEIYKISEQIKFLKSKNYKIFINLMQINRVSAVNLKKFLIHLNKLKCIDVFYFADSLGCLRARDVENICCVIKKNWHRSFGFHAHDNCGFALQNSLTAIKNGATWIDSTIQGMGRGAGNVRTESLITELIYLNKKNINYKIDPIFDLAQGYFLDLKRKYNWGSSVYYTLAANHNIHPTYIQEILSENRYEHTQIMKIIYLLKEYPLASSYNSNFLKENLFNKVSPYYWNAKNFFKDKTIVIIGQGPSAKNNKKKILKFIKIKKCVTFCLNINKFFLSKKYYNIISHEVRALIDQIEYKKINRIIMPLSRLNPVLKRNINKKNIKDYGLIINPDHINVRDTYAELPNALAIGYALSICKASSVKKVYLVGFDGYSDKEEVNLEMELYFKQLVQYFKKLNIQSLTKTQYSSLPISNLLKNE